MDNESARAPRTSTIHTHTPTHTSLCCIIVPSITWARDSSLTASMRLRAANCFVRCRHRRSCRRTIPKLAILPLAGMSLAPPAPPHHCYAQHTTNSAHARRPARSTSTTHTSKHASLPPQGQVAIASKQAWAARRPSRRVRDQNLSDSSGFFFFLANEVEYSSP